LQNCVYVNMLFCMRTTLDINDELLRQVKRRAADEGTSLRAVIESALRAHLGRSPKRDGYRLRWRTERGRLQPGARIEDREALFDLMEGRR
jgi:Arc/MetJ family transcription regulator